jgi:hypothetical protein
MKQVIRSAYLKIRCWLRGNNGKAYWQTVPQGLGLPS